MSDNKAAPIKPWELIDPKPLPEDLQSLLDGVEGFAALIDEGVSKQDAVAMDQARKLSAIYAHPFWVDEWTEARPPKPNAVGRPVEPNSRNRFTQWLTWRADKSHRKALASRHIYQLLKAKDVADYLRPGANNYTEKTIRPLAWMLTRDYGDRIPEVEKMAREIAAGAPVTDKVMSKALSEWKKKHLGTAGVTRANKVAKSKNFRPTCEADFKELLRLDPADAMSFLEWAADYYVDHADKSQVSA